jgi:hypothetical protein
VKNWTEEFQNKGQEDGDNLGGDMITNIECLIPYLSSPGLDHFPFQMKFESKSGQNRDNMALNITVTLGDHRPNELQDKINSSNKEASLTFLFAQILGFVGQIVVGEEDAALKDVEDSLDKAALDALKNNMGGQLKTTIQITSQQIYTSGGDQDKVAKALEQVLKQVETPCTLNTVDPPSNATFATQHQNGQKFNDKIECVATAAAFKNKFLLWKENKKDMQFAAKGSNMEANDGHQIE